MPKISWIVTCHVTTPHLPHVCIVKSKQKSQKVRKMSKGQKNVKRSEKNVKKVRKMLKVQKNAKRSENCQKVGKNCFIVRHTKYVCDE